MLGWIKSEGMCVLWSCGAVCAVEHTPAMITAIGICEKQVIVGVKRRRSGGEGGGGVEGGEGRGFEWEG